MDFGLDGVSQGYSVLEETAEPYEELEKALLPKRQVLESIKFAGKHGYPARQVNVVGRQANRFYTPQRRVQDTEGTMDRVIPGRLTTKGKQAAGVVGGGAALGGGGGAAYLAHDRKKVAKRQVDPETKRQRRLEAYQTGLTTGGLGAGAAGLGAYGAQTGRNVRRMRRTAEGRGKQNPASTKLPAPGRLRELPIRVVGAGLKPSKGQAAATLGGLGAVLAGDQIGRYRRGPGRSYNTLR